MVCHLDREIKIGKLYYGRHAPKNRRVRDIQTNKILYDVPGVLSFTPFTCSIEEFESWLIREDAGKPKVGD